MSLLKQLEFSNRSLAHNTDCHTLSCTPGRNGKQQRPALAPSKEACLEMDCSVGAGRTLLERWTVAYAAAAAGESRPPAGRPAAARLEPAGIYKRLVILLRSLYSYVRVLPAYRLLRACKVGAPACCQEGMLSKQLHGWRASGHTQRAALGDAP